MFATIISIAFVVIGVLATLVGIFKSRKYHWTESLVRLVMTILAAVITFVVTSKFTSKIHAWLIVPLETILKDTDVADFLKEVASAEDALSILISIVITPVVFITVFVFLKGLFNIILARPITKLCLVIAGAIAKKDYIEDIYGRKKSKKKKTKDVEAPKADETTESTEVTEAAETTEESENVEEVEKAASPRKKRKFTWQSALCGAVCGLFAYVVLLIPIVGTVELVATIGESITEEGNIHDISNELSHNTAVDVMHPISDPVWKNFTYYTLNGQEISIKDEAHFIAVFLEALKEASSTDEDTFHHSAEVFRNMSTLCPNTSLVPCLCSDFINAASAHWAKGEDFVGITMPEDELVATLVQCLTNSTPETMKEDLATISNVIAIITENATILEDGSINLTSLLENKDVVSALSVELINNPRLSPVLNKIVIQQIENTDSKIELPEKDGEEYTELVDNILDTYIENVGETITEDSVDNLSTAVGSILEEHGVTLEEHEKVAIASTFITQFGNPQDLTPEMIAEFIEQYRKEQ